jgi:hypothetical protein
MRWEGRVWLNPPFNRYTAPQWLRKMAAHGNGIALIAARTETKAFFESVWGKATSILFLDKRPHFHYADGTKAKANSGAPIVLIGYGEYNDETLMRSGLGKWLPIACRVPCLKLPTTIYGKLTQLEAYTRTEATHDA